MKILKLNAIILGLGVGCMAFAVSTNAIALNSNPSNIHIEKVIVTATSTTHNFNATKQFSDWNSATNHSVVNSNNPAVYENYESNSGSTTYKPSGTVTYKGQTTAVKGDTNINLPFLSVGFSSFNRAALPGGRAFSANGSSSQGFTVANTYNDNYAPTVGSTNLLESAPSISTGAIQTGGAEITRSTINASHAVPRGGR